MKRILALWLAALMLAAQPIQAAVCVGFGQSTGPTCSGDASNGDNESFEKGAGQFCTTDWTESDTSGAIDTYSTTGESCGDHALAVTCDSDTQGNSNRVYANVGSGETDIYVRLYVTLPTLSSGQYLRFFSIGNDNNESTSGLLYLQWFNNSGTYEFQVRDAADQATYKFNLTPGSLYRVDVHAVRSGNSTMRVYESNGDPKATSAGGTNYEQSVPTNDVAADYVVVRDANSSATAATIYIDDILVDVDGSGYIGAETCD